MHYWFQEFIGHSRCIRIQDTLLQIVRGLPHATHQQVVSLADPFPAVIPVHRIVPADQGGDPAHAGIQKLFQIPHIFQPSLWIRIPAIQKSMYKYLIIMQSTVSCSFAKAFEMVNMRMDPTIGKQSDKMDFPTLRFCIFKGLIQCRVMIQFTISYCFIDAPQFLINNPASAQIHVTNLRIAHLAGR